MKIRITLIIVALILFMLFSGCAGQPGGSMANASPPDASLKPTPAGADAEPATTSDAGLQEPEIDFSYDESACTPWQAAYLTLLRDIVSRETPERIAEMEGSSDADYSMQLSDRYSLYDVDKDDIPEIFITFGGCEADFRTEVYTYKGGSAVFVGDFGFSHSGLYTWPGENAVLRFWGHMGYGGMDRISIVDGDLVIEEIFTEDISEDPDAEYTDTSEIVPGSVFLPEFRTVLHIPMVMPLTLPIYDYCPPTSALSMIADGDTKKAVAEVLAGDRRLYGVSGDGFGGDTGWMSFDEYCRPGGVNEFADYPMQIKKSGWVDFDQNGSEECILYLKESPQAEYPTEVYVVLSEQDHVVYAYCLNYVYDHEVFQDGTFSGGYWLPFRVSFYKNQCYTYEIPHETDAPPIEWEIYGES